MPPPLATLLLVEDDPAFRRLARVGLEDHGFAVVDVADAEAALYELTVQTVDCAVVDIGLPGMDGLELVREISQRGCAATVVVTGRPAGECLHAGQAAGADDILVKPLPIRVVAERVRAVLRRTGHHRPPLRRPGP